MRNIYDYNANHEAALLEIIVNFHNKTLSISICSIVNDIVSRGNSHAILDQLFERAGAPGDPPDTSHQAKWKQWLKRASDHPMCDAHSVLGRVIEEFMEVLPVKGSFRYDEDIEFYTTNKHRLEEAPREEGLKYAKGGIVKSTVQGFGTKALEKAFEKHDFNSLEVEFRRALDSVDADPGSAITAACAILEAFFIVYLERHSIDLPNKKSIKPLWTKVQSHLGLDPKGKDDQDILKILSGMSSIVDGIGAFRTHNGSAHGGGKLRYKTQPRHARLTINAAHTLAFFLIETWEAKIK